MKKTLIKCTSRVDWGRIIQWAEEIEPNCTKHFTGIINYYYGFDSKGSFCFWKAPVPSDYTVLELSDFIAYPVKKYMMVSDDEVFWKTRIIIGETNDNVDKLFVDSNGNKWYHAKPINPNQGEIDEIDKQIAELTKRKEKLL